MSSTHSAPFLMQKLAEFYTKRKAEAVKQKKDLIAKNTREIQEHLATFKDFVALAPSTVEAELDRFHLGLYTVPLAPQDPEYDYCYQKDDDPENTPLEVVWNTYEAILDFGIDILAVTTHPENREFLSMPLMGALDLANFVCHLNGWYFEVYAIRDMDCRGGIARACYFYNVHTKELFTESLDLCCNNVVEGDVIRILHFLGSYRVVKDYVAIHHSTMNAVPSIVEKLGAIPALAVPHSYRGWEWDTVTSGSNGAEFTATSPGGNVFYIHYGHTYEEHQRFNGLVLSTNEHSSRRSKDNEMGLSLKLLDSYNHQKRPIKDLVTSKTKDSSRHQLFGERFPHFDIILGTVYDNAPQVTEQELSVYLSEFIRLLDGTAIYHCSAYLTHLCVGTYGSAMLGTSLTQFITESEVEKKFWWECYLTCNCTCQEGLLRNHVHDNGHLLDATLYQWNFDCKKEGLGSFGIGTHGDYPRTSKGISYNWFVEMTKWNMDSLTESDLLKSSRLPYLHIVLAAVSRGTQGRPVLVTYAVLMPALDGIGTMDKQLPWQDPVEKSTDTLLKIIEENGGRGPPLTRSDLEALSPELAIRLFPEVDEEKMKRDRGHKNPPPLDDPRVIPLKGGAYIMRDTIDVLQGLYYFLNRVVKPCLAK